MASSLAIGWALVASAHAHEPGLAPIDVTFSPDRTTYQIDVHNNLDAESFGVPDADLTPHQYRIIWGLPNDEKQRTTDDLRASARRKFRVRFDGQPVESTITFPKSKHGTRRGSGAEPVTPASVKGGPPDSLSKAADSPRAEVDGANKEMVEDGPYWGDVIRLSGDVPAGAKEFTFWVSKTFGTASLKIVVDGSDPWLQPLPAGEESDPYPLTRGAAVMRKLQVAKQYLWLGFEHIVPKGLDHILFVVGLFLLSPKLRPLLWQVTAFTLAHSVTLALSIYEVISLPPSIVEPLIALSIAYVAVENLCTTRLKPWRPAVVFAFGLLHGLGFAGVLTELGLPRQQYVTALVSFNVGVELGQLAVILAAALITAWCRNRTWYRQRIVVPASLAIALVGAYWAVERALA